jgi:type II secretory pathway predicted ATPase ExeA
MKCSLLIRRTVKKSKKASPFEATFLKHLALNEKPFGGLSDPAFFFASRSHSEALHALDAFVGRNTGVALVYGDVGVGKTLVRTLFVDALDKSRFDVGLIPSPPASAGAFLSEIAGQFGAPLPPGCSPREVTDALASRYSGRTPVLVVDEAETLSDEALGVLPGLLREGAGAFEARLRIVLFGRAELVSRLLGPGMENVRRRVTTTHCLQALTAAEVAPYIMRRLSRAGSNNLVRLTQDAANGVHAASRGYPGIIDTICDRCLLLLQERVETVIDGTILREALRKEGMASAIQEAAGNVSDRKTGKGLRLKIFLLTAFVILVALGLLSWWLLGIRLFPGY